MSVPTDQSTTTTATRAAQACFSAALALVLGGCFNPNYGDGGFACTVDQECPDGYACRQINNSAEPGTFLFVCQRGEGSAGASVTLSSTQSTVAAGEVVKVVATVENFIVDPAAIGGAKVDGRGHFHVYFDTVPDNYLFLTADAQFDVQIPSETTAGGHTIIAVLAHNNHQLLDPRVEGRLSIIVTPARAR